MTNENSLPIYDTGFPADSENYIAEGVFVVPDHININVADQIEAENVVQDGEANIDGSTKDNKDRLIIC